jgi:iron complex transport system permease protein
MSSSGDEGLQAAIVWRPRAGIVIPLLILLLAVAVGIAVTSGAAGIPAGRLFDAIFGYTHAGESERDRLILWSIRLPRIAMAMLVGGMLAAAGAIMQGLFRNPLADPSLVGVSSGAGLAAAATIVIGDRYRSAIAGQMPIEALPLAAFVGALIATYALFRLATRDGRTSIAIFLLGGIAIAALANAGIGLLVFTADDQQLRDVTFWLLGSLAGATWAKAAVIAPALVIVICIIGFVARGLDLLVLGEAEAFHAGISVQRLKIVSILVVAAATGAAVSVSGIIGFIGIVVPHLLRLVVGPGHRLLLPGSILLGAALLVIADTAARTVVAPAEIPIGIITAAVGAPFFLVMLLRQRSIATL